MPRSPRAVIDGLLLPLAARVKPAQVLPVLAGTVLTVAGTEHPDRVWAHLPVWAIAVIVGYRLLLGPWRQSLPQAGAALLAGAACAAVMPYVDLNRSPYDHVMVGLAVFVLTHTAATWRSRSTTAAGAHLVVAVCCGAVGSAGLVVVVEQSQRLGTDAWPAAALASVAGLLGVAVLQAARIWSLTAGSPANAADVALVRPRAELSALAITRAPRWPRSVTDERTGLWRYDRWRSHLRDIVQTRPEGQRLGVVFLDLDHFEQVNRDYGHLRADQLLAAVGERLGALTPEWTFGRFGGDEFVGLTTQVCDAAALDHLCDQVSATLRRPIETDGITISISASIGRTFSANRVDTAETLLARAERDLRYRKATRTDPAAPIVAFDHDEILRRVLHQGVDVAYQPIVDLRTRHVVGWEALLRGSLPMIGNLNPEQLVGSAVRAGVLDIVTCQLAKQALSTVTEASRRWGRRLSLSINIEQEQFRESNALLRWFVEDAERSEVDLILEITERGDADSWGPREDALADRLAAAGIGLALDDLGTGNSRMPLLLRRHWHVVKLDRGMLLHGTRGLLVLTHTVAMLRALGMPIVMEGVETAEQLELIQDLGIDRVQGHYFAAASTAADLFDFLDRYGLDFNRVTPSPS